MANTLKFGNGEWATKEGSTLAYNDENGNFKPLPFDFTRASSATVVNKAGFIETVGSNVPRIDFKDDSNGALKLEPQRSNLFKYSEYFGASYWTKTNATITDNATTSPEGLVNASAFTENTSTSTHFMRSELIIASASTYYSASFFVKYNGRHFQILGSTGSEGGGYVNFDLVNGDVGDSDQITGSIESLGNGWYKCTGTNISTASATEIRLLPYLCTSPTSPRGESYLGDGTSGIYIWGAQLEAGYPTSYIPTQGSIGTRVADACNNGANEQVINSTEGVFYFEGSALADDGTNRFLSLNDGTTNNYIYFRYVSTSNQYLFRTQVGGATVNTLSGFLTDTTENHKFAFKFKSGDYAMWVDGVEISTDTSSTIFPSNTLSNIEFSFPTDGGGGFQSKTRDLRVYNTALTDQELQALTTI